MRTPRPPGRVEPTTSTTLHPTGDDLVDLTDRRRVLLRLVFGVDVADADAVFAAPVDGSLG